jgi:electron transfer flavoprotein alpha subunit
MLYDRQDQWVGDQADTTLTAYAKELKLDDAAWQACRKDPAVEAAIQASGADIVLLGQTSLGRDLGPALAFKLKTAVAMDCVELKIDGGRLRATRAAYGGNARAEVTFRAPLQIVTVKSKSFDGLDAVAGRSGSVTTIDAAATA